MDFRQTSSFSKLNICFCADGFPLNSQHKTLSTFVWISAAGGFSRRSGNRFAGGVAEPKENLFRFFFACARKFLKRRAECFHSEIVCTIGAVHAVEKRSE